MLGNEHEGSKGLFGQLVTAFEGGKDDEGEEEHLVVLNKAISGNDEEVVRARHCLIDSLPFNIAVNVMTLLNTLQMGFEADHPEWTDAWTICENVFTAGFALEMVIKLFILRWGYFKDKANWLDGSLSVLGILDCWLISLLGGGADLQSLSVLRILRLMRLARILKLVRNFKPFVLVIQGVIQAISTTCYVFALLLLILYVFAIFCTEHMGRGAPELYPGYSTVMEVIDEQEFMANYNPAMCFGSIPLSMLTLFNMAMMAEWAEIVRPVALKQPVYILVFIAFALLVAFSVMNVMIGSIVDSVFSESKRIDEAFKQEIKTKKLSTLQKVQGLLTEMDTNKDGLVDLAELSEAMKHSTLLNDLMNEINLPTGWAATELLDMLDNSGDGVLQKGEFTTSFFRLMESDDFQQICIMQASINQVKHMLSVANKDMLDRITSLQSEMSVVRNALCLPTGSQDPVRHEGHPEKAASEPCSEPGEQHCHAHYKELGSEITHDAPPQCPDGVHNELRERVECIARRQLLETLDAIQESFQKEIGILKPSLEPKLEPKLSTSRAMLEENAPCHKAPSLAFAKGMGAPQADAGLGLQTPQLATIHSGVMYAIPDDLDKQDKHGPPQPAVQQSNPDAADDADCGRSIGDFESVVSSNRAGDSSNHLHDVLSSNVEPSVIGCPQHIAASEAEHHPGVEPAECQAEGEQELPPPPTETITWPNDSGPPDRSLHFTFEEGSPQLGFEIHWHPDGLPCVGRVMPNGAADSHGILPSDRLAECNGTSLAGKERDEVLQLLRERPLHLRMERHDG